MRLLGEKFPDELVIISVHSAKFPTEALTNNIRAAVMRHGLDHPVVNDLNFQVWQNYAIKAWPTVVVINPQGKIVHTQSGEILAKEFIPQIEDLLNEFEAKGLLDRTPLNFLAERTREPLRPLSYPSKLLPAADDRLFIADTGHHRILEVILDENGLTGEIVRVFGNGQPGLQDGPAATAMFHGPHGLALSDGTLYVADTENHAVRAIDLASGLVRRVAGTGEKAHGRFIVGEPAETPLRSPWALWIEDHILFIAMAGSHQVWVMVDEREIGPFVGNGREALLDGLAIEASFNQPSDLSLGMGYLFVADAEASAIRAVSLLEEKARVVTLVGQGLFEFGDVDGMGGLVRLQHPTGVSFADGLVYIADSYNHKIKTLDPTTGQVKTVIGTGQPGQADGPFAQAELFEPEGIAVSQGRLYIADTNNHLIRVADLAAQQLHTLNLRGLERLQQVQISQVRLPDRRFDPQVVGMGQVTFYFDIELPGGYKFNAEAPLMVQVIQNGVSTRYTFESEQGPTVILDMQVNQELIIGLMLYYCEIEQERLCLIHDTSFVLPCLISETGPTTLHVPYQILHLR